jgi:hypothetical protein
MPKMKLPNDTFFYDLNKKTKKRSENSPQFSELVKSRFEILSKCYILTPST